ncbi:MAG TPA: GNAT family N-acetyltransferase [Chitinophagaceae bacterium]|nr:GNAT family N-acetyltransferase [Chitinophagaceae bacterium]
MKNWVLKKFDDLDARELYAILQLRHEVFVVEQNCVFQDADDKDFSCLHLMAWQDGKLVAYSRIAPPGKIYAEASIGRVVTSPALRKKGLGKELMELSLKEIEKRYGPVPVKLGAQLYLKKFYTDLGFLQAGPPYLEDGIEHIEMFARKNPK